jgi:hypothetical protein
VSKSKPSKQPITNKQTNKHPVLLAFADYLTGLHFDINDGVWKFLRNDIKLLLLYVGIEVLAAGVMKNFYLLECVAIKPVESQHIFQRNKSLPKRRFTFNGLHSVISQDYTASINQNIITFCSTFPRT